MLFRHRLRAVDSDFQITTFPSPDQKYVQPSTVALSLPFYLIPSFRGKVQNTQYNFSILLPFSSFC